MAYGKGQINVMRRSIPTGITTLDLSVLPAGKLNDALIICKKFLAVANAFVDAVFNPEPPASTRTSEEIQHDACLLWSGMEILASLSVRREEWLLIELEHT